jgi:predicted dehydrogenase
MSARGSAGGPGVGVVGLGFMGRTHVAAFRAAARAGHGNRLVAVCDPDPERRAGRGGGGNLATGAEAEQLFDPRAVAGYARPEELFADERVELVSICTPTDSHVDLALLALAAGKHVLVEKPLALTHPEVARLGAGARAAQARGLLCMPALCMRFWPGWEELKRAAEEGAYGALKSIAFQRLGAPPAWNPGFYRDAARTGGALIDLHLHDADFLVHLCGLPESVASTGSLDHVTTLYRYAPGAGPEHAAAEGGWNHAPGFGFRMRYVAVFEQATLDFDFGREPRLELSRDGRASAVPLAADAGYEGEVRHLLDAVAGRAELRVTVADAEAHARLLDAERESLRSGRPVPLFAPAPSRP